MHTCTVCKVLVFRGTCELQPSCDIYVNLARATYGSTIYFGSCPHIDIHKYMLYVGLYVFMYACVAMNICAPFW
jgi:hypothetical protein